MVNKITLIGNLGADPEVRAISSGVKVARIRLATSESYKDNDGNWQDRTEWHTVIMWRDQAERAEKWLKKGMTIYVEGRMTYRDWETSEGQKRLSAEVVSNYYKKIKDPGTGGGNYAPMPEAERSANKPAATKSATPATATPVVADAGDDDLPF